MKKILPLSKVVSLSKRAKIDGKTVGLIVGSFDILHMGHIRLFQFAKKNSDIVIVGLDHDKTITLSKGPNRPVNNYKRRSAVLSELSSVDYIFKINQIYKHGEKKASKHIASIYKQIHPYMVFTSINCDSHWKDRRAIARSLGIKFIPEKGKKVTSSSEILKILSSEM